MTEVRTCFHCGERLDRISLAIEVDDKYQLWHIVCLMTTARKITLTLDMLTKDISNGAM